MDVIYIFTVGIAVFFCGFATGMLFEYLLSKEV
jgi:hypothetical protein